jgi:hypothetical protein
MNRASNLRASGEIRQAGRLASRSSPPAPWRLGVFHFHHFASGGARPGAACGMGFRTPPFGVFDRPEPERFTRLKNTSNLLRPTPLFFASTGRFTPCQADPPASYPAPPQRPYRRKARRPRPHPPRTARLPRPSALIPPLATKLPPFTRSGDNSPLGAVTSLPTIGGPNSVRRHRDVPAKAR